ncbi:MAG: NlpC/P60 family protein [Mycobacteriales bacterium]
MSARPIARLVRYAALPAVAAVACLGLTATSQADPTMTKAQAQQKVTDLYKQAADLNEAYNKAKIDADNANKRLPVIQAQIDAQQSKIDSLSAVVAQFAASAYRGGRITSLTSLLETNSPQTFLDQMATLGYLSAAQRASLTDLVKTRKSLDKQLKDAQTTSTTASQALAVATQRNNEGHTLMDQAKSIEKQYHLYTDMSVGTPPDNPEAPPARAVAVIQYAKQQLGKPYSWGAAGPDRFDCSGLTMMAWRQAGVDLPHQSYDQYTSITHIPLSQIEPGDLIFYGRGASGIHHVAIYVGGGKIIHAPQENEVVKYADIHMESDLFAAGRP